MKKSFFISLSPSKIWEVSLIDGVIERIEHLSSRELIFIALSIDSNAYSFNLSG